MPASTTFDVFLSYTHDDVVVVEAIACKLRDRGVRLFFDRWQLIGGEAWPGQLEQALADSACCAAFIGSGGWWSNAEREAALVRSGDGSGFRIIPVLLDGDSASLPLFLRRLHSIEYTNGGDDELAFEALYRAIHGEAMHPAAPPERVTRERLDDGIIHALPAAPQFVGRAAEFARLQAFWNDPSWSVASLIGLGGAGKTAVASEFLSRLLDGGDPPDDLFVWSFYVDHDVANFLRAALLHFGRVPVSGSGNGLLYRLNEYLSRRGRTLMILDGLERVQRTHSGAHGAFGEIEDPLLKQVLTRWAAGKGRLKCLITSRFPLSDLYSWSGKTYRPIEIDELAPSDARLLLRRNCVTGSDRELDDLVEEYGAHALVLDHLGIVISTFYDRAARNGRDLPDPNVESYVPQERKLARVLHAYEEWLRPEELELLERFCIFRFGSTINSLYSIFARSGPDPSISGSLSGRTQHDLQRIFTRLETLHLIVKERGARYTAHPAIRDHFYRRLTNCALMHRAVGKAVSSSWQITMQADYTHLSSHIRQVGSSVVESKPHRILAQDVREFIEKYRRHLLPATIAALNDAARELDNQRKPEMPAIRTSRADLSFRPGVAFPDDPELLDLLEEVIYQAVRAGEEREGLSVYTSRLGGMRHLGEKIGDYARGYRILRYFRKEPLPPRDFGFYQRALGNLREAFAAMSVTHDFWVGTLAVLLGYLPHVVDAKVGWPQAQEIAAFLCGRADIKTIRDGFGWGEALSPAEIHLIHGDVFTAEKYASLPDDPPMAARHRLVLAEARRWDGELAQAQEYVDAAAEWIVKSGSAEHLAAFHLRQALVHADRQQFDDAEHEFDEGLTIARRAELALAHIDLLNARAEVRLNRASADSASRDALIEDALADINAALDGIGTPVPLSQSDIDAAVIATGSGRRVPVIAADVPLEAQLRLIDYKGGIKVLDISLLPANPDGAIMGARHPECQYVWGERAAERQRKRAMELRAR